ncbi:hypothetical protein [Streptacidiphilus pinicola]|uniref:hypothetical protein n=1 Tax=Streptacidiphilus pinicola TaxID=2219663 RepID=UPI001057B6BE|nr:hypothetical protein [Streptacidiphilus pinicola]
MTTVRHSALNAADTAELERLVQRAARSRRNGLFPVMGSPGTDPDAVAELATDCAFDHVATLVFPRTINEVRDCLTTWGWVCAPAVPSVVVRGRLAARYALRLEDLDVWILHARKEGHPNLEVFCLPANRVVDIVAASERREGNERHLALLVRNPAPETLDRLAHLMVGRLGMVPDGGGYNPHEDRAAGGRSVLYFRHPLRGRLEVTCAGEFSDVLDRHLFL